MSFELTHWGRVTHICVSNLTIIGSDNGLSPGRRQAIIWTNDGILLIRTFRIHFSEIVSEIHTYSFKKMHFKMSSGKWRPSCLGLNVLRWGATWLEIHCITQKRHKSSMLSIDLHLFCIKPSKDSLTKHNEIVISHQKILGIKCFTSVMKTSDWFQNADTVNPCTSVLVKISYTKQKYYIL